MQAVGSEDLQTLTGVVHLPTDEDEGSTPCLGHVRVTQGGQLLLQQHEGELHDDMSRKGSEDTQREIV